MAAASRPMSRLVAHGGELRPNTSCNRTPDAVLFPDRGWLCKPCLTSVELYLESGGAES